MEPEWYVANVQSRHRSPVLNHTDPVNPRHRLRCTADASPLQPGGKASVATNLNLAYIQECTSTNSNYSCLGGATWRHQIGLL